MLCANKAGFRYAEALFAIMQMSFELGCSWPWKIPMSFCYQEGQARARAICAIESYRNGPTLASSFMELH